MCDPASLIGGALSIAGSVVQAQQQAAFVSAQNQANNNAYEISKRAREEELARQKAHEDAAATHWNQTSDALTREGHDEERGAESEKFMQNFDDLAAQHGPAEGMALSGQQYASEAVKEEIASRTNKAAAEARQRVQALANLNAYGTTDVARNSQLGDTSNYLQVLNGIRRGSLGVSGQEQSISPAQVSPGSSIFGDILSGAGGMVSSFGGKTVSSPTSISPRATAAIRAGASGLY